MSDLPRERLFFYGGYIRHGEGGEGSGGRDVNWPLGPGITNLYFL